MKNTLTTLIAGVLAFASTAATVATQTWPRAITFAVDTALATAGGWAREALTAYAGHHLVTSGVVPSAEAFAARRVTNPGQSEVIRQRFYDCLLYPFAGQAQFSFFSQPAGQGVTTALGAVVGTTKTLFDTNLEMPNTLPSGKEFMIESIEIIMLPGSVQTANTYTPAAPSVFNAVAAAAVFAQANDVNTFYQAGLVNLNILSKNYLREMTQAFPPKASLDVNVGVASNSATTAELAVGWAKAVGRPYYVEPEITLQPAVNFEVTLTYPAAVALAFNARIMCILDGYFMRASQ